MTTPQDDGGAAFPGLHPNMECRFADSGMSLRDWFAGIALQGLLAHVIGVEGANGRTSKYAERSYQYADAMIAARKEGA